MNWFDAGYLKEGTARQKLCYDILEKTRLFEILNEFSPVIVGTIPIEIDIPGSDMDVVCYVRDLERIKDVLRRHCLIYDSFSDKMNEVVYVANFNCLELPVEIYAEERDSCLQNGYRHMMIEYRILKMAGEVFRNKVIELKMTGLKTEPAFGKLLDLKEPFSDLLKLENLSDAELKDVLGGTLPESLYHMVG